MINIPDPNGAPIRINTDRVTQVRRNSLGQGKLLVGDNTKRDTDFNTGLSVEALAGKLGLDRDVRLGAIVNGDVPGMSYKRIFAESALQPRSGNFTIWENTVAPFYLYPSGTSAVNVVSDQAFDTATGTNFGARSVDVTGLDANMDEVTENLPLNGTTGVNTSTLFARLNDVVVAESGLFNGNVGTLVTTYAGGQAVDQMPPLFGASRLAFFTVPRGFDYYILNYRVEAVPAFDEDLSAAPEFRWARAALLIQQPAVDSAITLADQRVFKRFRQVFMTPFTPVELNYNGTLRLPQGTDVETQIINTDGPCFVSSEIEGILVQR